MVLNYTGLRISDALMLSRDRIQNWEILIYTQKNGIPVWMPLQTEMERALELLPLPRGAEAGCRYYFWDGTKSRRALLGIAERTLQRVFALSGVANAHAHRFRHTLAIRILTTGGTIDDVARILGNTPAIAFKHYAPWCQRYQDRIREVIRRAYQPDIELLHSSDTEKKRPLIQ